MYDRWLSPPSLKSSTNSWLPTLDTIVSEGNVSSEGLKAFRASRGYYVAVANEVGDTTLLFRLRLAGGRDDDEDEDDEGDEHGHD